MVGFVFCHGWGFSPSFWDNLKVHFKTSPCLFWDLGYFGKESRPWPTEMVSHYQWIGIGHSLGFLKLLESSKLFTAIIGLQGFTNFLGLNPVLNKVRKKYLKKMMAQFEENPIKTLVEFRKTCGFPLNTMPRDLVDCQRLLRDLKILSKDYSYLLVPIPYLILGSQDDQIVPRLLLEDNFNSQKNVKLIINDKGQHQIGASESIFVKKEILDFLEKNV